MTKVRSPIRWFGGKHYLAPFIISHMPPHKCYVEPFGGGAHVLTQKPPSEVEIYNDIDDDLVNFLLVLKKDPERLAKALDGLPYSRSLYEQWKWEERPKDKFERAVRWFYIMRGKIGGDKHRSGWRHSKERNPANDYQAAIELLDRFAERFKRVMIECMDFRKIIKTYDGPSTLFYIDPPYRGREGRYKGNFSDKDHRDLADMLETIQGKAIVSYYPDEFINHLYQGWRRIETESWVGANVLKNSDIERTRTTELLLMNFDDAQMNIFEYGVI